MGRRKRKTGKAGGKWSHRGGRKAPQHLKSPPPIPTPADNGTIQLQHYRWKVTLLEDLHSGTGGGGSSVDQVIARDRNHRPVIPASHLKGVLRSAAETLQQFGYCTESEIQALLGKPGSDRGRALTLTSLYLQPDQQAKQNRAPAEETLVWESSGRKPYDRSPKSGTLRQTEYLRAGTCLQAELELSTQVGEVSHPLARLAELLEQIVRHVDRLGATRSRGSGLIQSVLEKTDMTDRPKLRIQPSSGGGTLMLLLCNLEPLNLPETGQPRNQINTAPYIRGQQLLGALTAWSIKHFGEDNELFARKHTVHNGYPLPREFPVEETVQQRSQQLATLEVVPTPLHLYQEKPGGSCSQGGDGVRHPWWVDSTGTTQRVDQFQDHAERDEKAKRPDRSEFLYSTAADQKSWQSYTPEIGVRLRNQIHAADLFSEETIAERSYFLTSIHFPSKKMALAFQQRFSALLNGGAWLRVGRGGRPVVVEGGYWKKSPQTTEIKPLPRMQLRVTLTSDAVFRDPWLHFYTDLTVCSVNQQLGGVLTKEQVDMIEPCCRSYCETVELHGFNGSSGLPRAPRIALRRGSTLQITAVDDDREKQQILGLLYSAMWQRLQSEAPLGEQGWEGLGQFRLDFAPRLISREAQRRKPGGDPLPAAERLVRAAHELANQLRDKEYPYPPSTSQLQGLRSGALARRNDPAQLQQWMSEVLPGRKKWQPYRQWLRLIVKNEKFSAEMVDLIVRWLIHTETASAGE